MLIVRPLLLEIGLTFLPVHGSLPTAENTSLSLLCSTAVIPVQQIGEFQVCFLNFVSPL